MTEAIQWPEKTREFHNHHGRWSETLTPEQVIEYEKRSGTELGDACAHWLATGQEGR